MFFIAIALGIGIIGSLFIITLECDNGCVCENRSYRANQSYQTYQSYQTNPYYPIVLF